MGNKISFVAVAILCLAPAFSQTNVPATQSSASATDDDLRRIVRKFAQQNADLKADVERLKSELLRTKAQLAESNAELEKLKFVGTESGIKNAKTFVPSSTFSSRASRANFPDTQTKKTNLAQAKAIDDRIAAYLVENKTDDDTAAAMYGGEYKIGMTHDAADAISGQMFQTSESEHVEVDRAYIWQAGMMQSDMEIKILTFRDGKLVQISEGSPR